MDGTTQEVSESIRLSRGILLILMINDVYIL